MAREWITRRRLPHWYVPGAVHFVTYRLAGTIPVPLILELREQRQRLLKQAPPEGTTRREWRRRAHKRFFAQYDRYLDSHRDVDFLARPPVAAMVRGNLHYHHAKQYHLLAYCVMPNHVHALIQPTEDLRCGDETPFGDELPDARSPLAQIMHSLKSYTAYEANKLLSRSGQFWQHESYDHWIRDDEELARIAEYIAANPVAAGLADQPHEWPWGSVHDRFLRDGTELGLLWEPIEELPDARPGKRRESKRRDS